MQRENAGHLRVSRRGIRLWAFVSVVLLLVTVTAGTIVASPWALQYQTSVPRYGIFEVALTTSNAYANPYTDVSLSATFQGPTRRLTTEGFWDGGNTWKVRLSPSEVGTWTLVDVTSNDAQLNNQGEGLSFTSRLPTADEIAANEVLRHGFVQVNPAYPHTFAHADGTPFFLMGDTQWGNTFLSNYFSDGTFQQVVDGRARQGFNAFTVSTFAVERSLANEGGPPFNGTYTNNQLNAEFFKWVDKRFDYMTRKNIRPMILLGSPDKGLTTNTDFLTRFQRYLIARYAAYDIIWLGVKEYEEWGSSAATAIRAIGDTLQRYDPYGHVASTHTANSTSELGGDAWLDYNALQRGGALNGAPAQAGVSAVVSSYQSLAKPVIQAEAFYEEPSTCPGPNYFSDPQVLLEGLWAIQLHGGWNAGYRLTAECTNTDMAAYLSKMNNTSAAYHSYFKRFFEGTEFWKLVPNNRLVLSGTAWAAAQPGKEYVLFLKDGGNVTVDISAATGTMNVAWYNPRTGTYSGQTTTTGGGSRAFSAPFSGDAVLHIKSKADNTFYSRFISPILK